MKQKRRFWTKREIEYLESAYPTYGARAVARKLKRTPGATAQKAATLGVSYGFLLGKDRIAAFEIAAEAGLNLQTVKKAAERDGVATKGQTSRRIISVPQPWAKRYLKRVAQLKANYESYSHWYSSSEVVKFFAPRHRSGVMAWFSGIGLMGDVMHSVERIDAIGPGGFMHLYNPEQIDNAYGLYKERMRARNQPRPKQAQHRHRHLGGAQPSPGDD